MIREVISIHFQAPMQKMSFLSYLTYLNSAGKISQRSLLELLIILCDQIEELEKKNELYEKNFKDIEEILGKLLSSKKVQELDLDDPRSDTIQFDKPSVSSPVASDKIEDDTPQGEATAFPCDQCDKSFKLKVALAGHKRSHGR